MTITEDSPHDIGRQEAEPQEPREVGCGDADLASEFGDGLSIAPQDHGVESLRPCKKTEHAAVRLAARSAARSLDQQPRFHTRAFQPGRDRENEDGSFIVQGETTAPDRSPGSATIGMADGRMLRSSVSR